jgi:hypothetical protein
MCNFRVSRPQDEHSTEQFAKACHFHAQHWTNNRSRNSSSFNVTSSWRTTSVHVSQFLQLLQSPYSKQLSGNASFGCVWSLQVAATCRWLSSSYYTAIRSWKVSARFTLAYPSIYPVNYLVTFLPYVARIYIQPEHRPFDADHPWDRMHGQTLKPNIGVSLSIAGSS